MKRIKKILLATDFGRGSNQAARAAMHLATSSGSQVVLMHVLPERGVFALIADELQRQADERLAALAERFAAEGIAKVSRRTVTGDPREEIVTYAELMDVSLVVLGSGRLDARQRPRFGSTAEKIARHCRKPVWIAHPSGSGEIKRILCPVDMSDHSSRALRHAIRLAEQRDAALTVIHVVRPLDSILGNDDLLDDSLESAHFAERARRFARFLGEHDCGAVRWSKSIKSGIPAALIVKTARAEVSDLIVMGSAGRTGIPRLLMGSVALKVIRAFPCSVLTVKDVDALHPDLGPELENIWKLQAHGRQLLEEQQYEDAREQFQLCISRNPLLVQAWEGLAEAHEKLGHAAAAARCRESGIRIFKEIWERRIENEIRARKTRPRQPRAPRNAS